MADRLARPWDRGYPGDVLLQIQRRRVIPDGREVPVTTKKRGGQTINCYPFSEMGDGDYFFVDLGAKKENAFRAYIRQAGGSQDVEYCIAELGGVLRVTRVASGVARAKRNCGIRPFDATRRKEYLSRHGKERRRGTKRVYEEGAQRVVRPNTMKKFVPKKEVVNPLGVGSAPDTGANKSFRERLEEAKRAAKREKAGIEDDDPDFMGVGDS